MENQLPKEWYENLSVLDIAFQPILNIHTGKIFAVEALLRNHKEAGFESIFDIFDEVYKKNILYSFDLELRKKTIKKFTEIAIYQDLKLFYNLDNRLFEMPNFAQGNTKKILLEHKIKKDTICFEISERHQIDGIHDMQTIMQHYKDDNYCIAIDDFGVGYSGYKLLHDVKPDILKIDRFFLQDVHKHPKKKVMLKSITHLAVQLGIQVVAEGVETIEELLVCRDVGCHLVQGYFIQRPTTDVTQIKSNYTEISDIINKDQRFMDKGYEIRTYIKKIPTLYIKTKMATVIEYFKKHQESTIIPIVNSHYEPVGILQDDQIKDFLYSPYGRSLLLNDDSKKSKLKNLINPCAIADINSEISTIIELFSNNPESIGIIITKDSEYYGFLSARAIITIMNEQNLLFAREQNPLTKLPGNTMIEKYVWDASKSKETYLLCYFDLDNFKAFNDVYGFRNGDRVIQLFADILRKNLPQEFFKAHIGGDDFFVGIKSTHDDNEIYITDVKNIVKKFTDDVIEFYSQDDKARGYILSKDREGNKKEFPLLTVSASVLLIHKRSEKRCVTKINNILSVQKKVAKHELSHVSLSCMI
ncbi:GGDEF domain-containing protein [Sulfurimonas sp.]|uniref:GGDEF domain-containing protein n=1 Tax=Sulfurimonas sp. TaxID=2022749 RepID=UPI003569F2B1